MRGRGWRSQSDYDFPRFFRQLGVYERSLPLPQDRPGAESCGGDAAGTARSLLMLHRMEEAEVMRKSLAG